MSYESPGYQKSRIEVSPVLKYFNCQRSKQDQGGLNWTRQADSLGIPEYGNLKKLSSQVHTLRASDCFDGIICQSRPVHSKLCASSILDTTQKPLISLYKSQIFYTDFLDVIAAINLKIICVASDIRQLRNFGAYLKRTCGCAP